MLKQLFQIAVDDRIIVESPASKLKTPWKRPQKPVRHVPTADQFKALVNSIRNQSHSDTAEATADFVEFLGLAGVGQAEASHLTWGDIDWQKEKINFRRRKTQNLFHVPFYHHLKFFMNQLLRKRPKNFSPNTRVFQIKDAKVALANANKRLGFDPPFSQRNLRQHLIQQLWRSGVDVKYISEWQGHQDGGQLILDTYTETFGSNDQQHVANQLAKLVPSQAPPIPHMTMGWINASRQLSQEEKELRKLWDHDPANPVREGTILWDERRQGWKVVT